MNVIDIEKDLTNYRIKERVFNLMKIAKISKLFLKYHRKQICNRTQKHKPTIKKTVEIQTNKKEYRKSDITHKNL